MIVRKKRFYLAILVLILGVITLLNSITSITGLAILENSAISRGLNIIGIALIIGGGLLLASSRHYYLTSRIKVDNGLVRLAEEASRNVKVQRDIDHLTHELERGNTNPGLGSKNLFGNVIYVRGRNGGRVFVRPTIDGGGYEILGKASKGNENRVIEKIEEIYGIPYKRKVS